MCGGKNFRNFDYVSRHLRHFSKCEAAISKLRVAFENLYAWLKRAQYCFIWKKYLGFTVKELVVTRQVWVFFWQKSKMFCLKSKLSLEEGIRVKLLFQLSYEVLNLYYFPYIMKPWRSKFCPQKSKNRSLPPSPTNGSWVGEII